MKMIIFFAVVFAFKTAEAKSSCDGPIEAPGFQKILDRVEAKIREFSNSKLIASQADQLLSKLLTAKSPVIVSWMNKRDLGKKSEDEIAKEWRFYFAKNFVLIKYPTSDAKMDAAIENLVDGILKETLTSEFKTKLEKLFKQAKDQSIATLETMKIEKKEELLARVKAIELYWPTQLKTARNQAIPLDLIDWGIAYDPEANGINVGVRALSYPNDETFLAVFAHEIGHSFDSCRWGAYLKGPWPFEKVGECLRSAKSVGAKKRDDSQLETLTKKGHLSAELATSLKRNPTCNKLIYPPAGIQADQLPEAFADWFSAEVISRIPKMSKAKIRTDLCEKKELLEGSSYPQSLDRLNRIYFAHPKFKDPKDKGSSEIHFCNFD